MGKTSAIPKFQNLIGKTIFACPGKALRVMYQIAPVFAEETESSKKPNVIRDSRGVLYYCRRPHRKTTNTFSISRASVSPIIKKVSYAIAAFSRPKPIKLPTTKNKVKELTNKLLRIHEFP